MCCPYCGGSQIVSRKPFELDGEKPRVLVDVEHMRCTSCDGVTLTMEQLRKMPASAAL